MDMQEDRRAYSRREIDLILQPIDDKLGMICEQLKKVNGRVNNLERWKSFVHGGLSILTLMVVPLLIFVITKWIK